MTRNISHTKLAIAHLSIERERLQREHSERYTELVREACAVVDRYERKRLARGTSAPVASYTDTDLAWFRRPVSL